jgi:DNA-binding MarR family transcriptional regulator
VSPAPAPAVTTRSLGSLLSRVERRVTRRLEAALGPDGPGLDQWRILDLLADGSGRAMSTIAAHTLIPAPTLTKVVDRLVDSALVHRRPDDVDRRRVLVLLTEHGHATHARLVPEVARAEQAVAVELGEPDAAHLHALLGRLAERLG